MDATSDIASGQILPFRRIKNNVGNGYDVNTFKFRPPYNGTYEFMLQIMAGQNTHCKGEITVNEQKGCRAHTGPGSTDSLLIGYQINNGDFFYLTNSFVFNIYIQFNHIQGAWN